MSQPFSKIILVIDRSGSMAAIREVTIRAVHDFMRDLNAMPGRGLWTLVQFDDPDTARGAGEEFPQIIFEDRDGRELPEAPLAGFQPRGSTALVDALHVTLERARRDYLRIPLALRPRVLVVIQTDGHENASKRYQSSDLRRLTGELQSWDWQFIYLGANQDAFAVAQNMGLPAQAALHYAATPIGTQQVYGQMQDLARAWKAEGNQSAASLLSSAAPEEPKNA